jgi:hypothetical protein
MTVARTRWLTVLGAALLGVQPVAAQDLRFGGFVRLDRRISLVDPGRLADFYHVFRPELSASFEGQAEVVVSLDARFYGLKARSAEELARANRHVRSSVTLWEAFARISGFVVSPLDLTVGKQRILWGAADGLNPTDRFNAYDLSDLTDFTARVPVWAVRGEYYATADWRIEAVWTPTAHRPILSPGMDDLVGGAGHGAPPGPATSRTGHFETPSFGLRNSQYGFKVAGGAAGLDFSASYFDGFDGIPAVRRVTFLSPEASGSTPTYDAHVWSMLPRIRVLGADVAAEWRGVGLWAEGGIVLPDGVEIVTDVVTGSDSLRERGMAIEGKAYATWTVGGDYRFRGGWYLNLQWAHGLFLDRGAGQLHDYLIGKLERRLLRETVTVSLQGDVEVVQWSNWSDHAGYGVYPKVVYSPVDNVDLSVGGLLAGGRGDALFGHFGDLNQVYLRVEVSF